MKIGLQLYTVRDCIKDAENLEKLLQEIKLLGYDEVQVYGGLDLSEKLGVAAKNVGLNVLGTTGSFDEFTENPERTIEVHKLIGAEEIGIGGYSYKTEADVHRFIAKANDFADFAAKNGFKFSYHNHSHEFIKFENNKTAFDMLTENLNPENTAFVFDTYWAQHGGADVRYLIGAWGI